MIVSVRPSALLASNSSARRALGLRRDLGLRRRFRGGTCHPLCADKWREKAVVPDVRPERDSADRSAKGSIKRGYRRLLAGLAAEQLGNAGLQSPGLSGLRRTSQAGAVESAYLSPRGNPTPAVAAPFRWITIEGNPLLGAADVVTIFVRSQSLKYLPTDISDHDKLNRGGLSEGYYNLGYHRYEPAPHKSRDCFVRGTIGKQLSLGNALRNASHLLQSTELVGRHTVVPASEPPPRRGSASPMSGGLDDPDSKRNCQKYTPQ
jgi:hypothetical protein